MLLDTKTSQEKNQLKKPAEIATNRIYLCSDIRNMK